MMPTASSVPSAWKPPTRLSTTRPRKTRWVGAAGAADRAQEARIQAFEHQRPIDQRQRDQRQRGDRGDQRPAPASSSARTVPNRTCSRSTFEPCSETISHAERERDQVEGRKRGILTQRGEPGDERRRAGRRRGPRPARRASSPASERPATRKPTAAPGRIACAMASPVSDMRRSIRNTPIGPAPSASVTEPTSARRMNSNSAKGAISSVVEHHGPAVRPPLAQAAAPGCPRPRSCGGRAAGLGRQHVGRRAPGDVSRASSRRSGKWLAHDVEVVQHGDDRARLAVPASHQSERSAVVLVSIAVKGSSSRMMPASWRSRRANSARCICPPESDADGPRLETGQADRRDRGFRLRHVLAADAAEQAGPAPQAHGDEIVDVDGEASIDLGGLRQIGDGARGRPVAPDSA